jgi:hypothetical protein
MRPIDHAFLYLGVQEDRQLGPNRGKMIDAWLRRRRLEPDRQKNPMAPERGYPWCSCFACAMVEDAGFELDGYSASAHRLVEKNQALLVPVEQTLEGDIVAHLKRDGTGHVAIVRFRKSGRLHTIDGNSNKQGAREGTEVALVDRPIDYWTHAIRPRGRAT